VIYENLQTMYPWVPISALFSPVSEPPLSVCICVWGTVDFPLCLIRLLQRRINSSASTGGDCHRPLPRCQPFFFH